MIPLYYTTSRYGVCGKSITVTQFLYYCIQCGVGGGGGRREEEMEDAYEYTWNLWGEEGGGGGGGVFVRVRGEQGPPAMNPMDEYFA